MKNNCSTFFLPSIIIIICIFLLCQTGCRSFHRAALGRRVPQTASSFEKVITTQTQDLSMARRLKDLPPCEYILGPEDTVEISVLNHDELKMEVSVSPTGRIPYYFIGDIEASGLTQFQLRDYIQQLLAEFIKDPKVVVRITEHRSHKVYVLGQVKDPGVYRIKSEMTLLEAISSAGGITPDAYLDGAYLVRSGKILLVNFFELIKQGNTDENIPLLPGDIAYIPDRKDHKIYVLGEVNNQAAIPMEEGLTFLGAITQAGGFTRDANKKAIVLLRGNLSEPEILIINIEQLWNRRSLHTREVLNRDYQVANIPLQKGDIVYIPSRFISDVERAAIRLSNILDPFLKIERGIILHDTAIDVLEGKDRANVIVSD